MRFGGMWIETQSLLESRDGTLEIAVLSKPDPDRVIDPAGGCAGRRMGC
jgi:hypothetical protein